METRTPTEDGENYGNLYCSNHFEMKKNAKRYCTQCKKFLCNDCLVEFDLEHLKSNMIVSMDSYVVNFKDNLEKVLKEIMIEKERIIPLQRRIKKPLDEVHDEYIIKIENFTRSLTTTILNYSDNVKREISIMRDNTLNEIKNRYPLFKYIEVDFDRIIEGIRKQISSWDINLNKDKMRMISEFSGNSVYNNFLNDINNITKNLENNRINDNYAREIKTQYENNLRNLELDKKATDIGNILRTNIQVIERREPSSIKKNYPTISFSKLEFSVVKENKILGYKDDIPGNQFDYDFIMGTKSNSSTIIVYYNNTIKEINFTQRELETFTGQKNCIFPLKNSKSVNIGKAMIITGGNLSDKETNLCYSFTPNLDGERFEYSVKNFPKMKEARERHNIIHLPNLNLLLVCCSFTSQNSAEIINIVDGKEWKKIPNLNKRRANATMAYLNNRWIYCISGFLVEGGNNGKYLTSYEILDAFNIDNGWREINYNPELECFKLSAMGCIELTNSIILIGGYDGARYVKNTYVIDIEDDGVFRSKKELSNNLDTGLIFPTSRFIKSGKAFLNFDFNRMVELISLK